MKSRISITLNFFTLLKLHTCISTHQSYLLNIGLQFHLSNIVERDSKNARKDADRWTIHDGVHVVYSKFQQNDDSVRGHTFRNGFSFGCRCSPSSFDRRHSIMVYTNRSSPSVLLGQQNEAQAQTFTSSLHFRTILSLYFPSFSLT